LFVNYFFKYYNKKIEKLSDLIEIPFSDMSFNINQFININKKIENDRVKNPRTINRKQFAIKSFFNFLVNNY
jgi:hypothetical protein